MLLLRKGDSSGRRMPGAAHMAGWKDTSLPPGLLHPLGSGRKEEKMTENIFNKFGIKKGETAAPWNKGKGLACLMHFHIPDWAVEEKEEGEIPESLWRHFEENQYSVSFVPYFTRGKHVGEPNWQKESVRVMFKTREEAEAYMWKNYQC